MDETLVVPGDVPAAKRALFKKNFEILTKKRNNIALFAGDQHIEHLNDDFFGKTKFGKIPLSHSNPHHLFRIAQAQHMGAFAAQYGLISRHGPTYPHIPYIVKVNSKTNLVKTKQKDPYAKGLVNINDITALRDNAHLNIIGIGYTVYLGSEYEAEMLSEASRLIIDAHKQGMLATIFMYPRGKAVKNEKEVHTIAGATGVASCLGADIVKVNYPGTGKRFAHKFIEVVIAAGNTKVICAGGSAKYPKTFFRTMIEQIQIAGCAGNAIGRNIHQHDLATAIRMTKAISAITYERRNISHALNVYNKK